MDFVQTTLDDESVKIINVTGNDKNTSIAYIDSSNNLKVKVKPVSWEDFSAVQNRSLSTSASNFQIPNFISVGDYLGSNSATITSIPDGSIWVDDGTGEIVRKIRGQLLLEGGLLYHRQVGMSITATGTTTADAGTVLGRGGLKPIIRGGFFKDKQWTLFGKASLGVSFTNTSTQYFRLEILGNGSLIGALQIQPSSIPNVTSAVVGRIVDIYFDLAPTAAAWGDGSSVATRAHMVSFFEGGVQVGTGNSLVGLGYLMEHETYPAAINFNNDLVLTARISAPGGQTVYFNSLRWWI